MVTPAHYYNTTHVTTLVPIPHYLLFIHPTTYTHCTVHPIPSIPNVQYTPHSTALHMFTTLYITAQL